MSSSTFDTPRRSFSLPSRSTQSARKRESVSDTVELLFSHPAARIISFTATTTEAQNGPGKVENASTSQALSWSSKSERTLASGLIKIYRVKFQAAFLQCGSLVHPMLPKSAAWCVDDARSIFVLKIRQSNYWRVEITEVEGVPSSSNHLKDVLRKTIVFENTPCPFRIEKAEKVFEEQAPLLVFKRRLTISKPTWKVESLPEGQVVDAKLEETIVTSPKETQDTLADTKDHFKSNELSNGPENKSLPRSRVNSITPSIAKSMIYDCAPNEIPLPASPVLDSFVDFLSEPVSTVNLFSISNDECNVSNDSPVSPTTINTINVGPVEQVTDGFAKDISFNRFAPSPQIMNITRSVTAPVITTISSPPRYKTESYQQNDLTFADIATGRSRNERRTTAIPRPMVISLPRREQRNELEGEGYLSNPLRLDCASAPLSSPSIDGRNDSPRPNSPPTPTLSSSCSGSDDWSRLSTPESSVFSKTPNSSVRSSASYDISVMNMPCANSQRNKSKSKRERAPTFSDMTLSKDNQSEASSLTSLAHRTTTLILNKTLKMAVLRPTSYVANFMLSFASRVARGSTVYSYYWAAQDSPDFVDLAGRNCDLDEYEDDFGVNLMGPPKDRYQPRRRSRSSSIQEFLNEKSF